MQQRDTCGIRCRFVGGLSGLHIYFTSQNTTTYEHFRSRYNAQGNPYDVGLLRNWMQVFCMPMAPRLREKLPGRVSSPSRPAQAATYSVLAEKDCHCMCQSL